MQIADRDEDSAEQSEKEALMVHQDPDYVAVLSTEFLKKKLRSHGPYGYYLEATK